MPQHHVLLNTPERVVAITPPIAVDAQERAVLACGAGVKLRRLSSDETRYDSRGLYKEAVVTLENWKARGLLSLYGFQADEQAAGDFAGVIGYQLSPDAGVTWYVFDTVGIAWVVAVGAFVSVYNPQEVVDEQIQTFPVIALPGGQVQVRARLTPEVGGRRTPVLQRVTLMAELDYDYERDVIVSLKHYIEQNLKVRSTWRETLSVAAASTLIKTDWAQVLAPVRVFNLTADPGRTVNLFLSVVGKTVNFTAPQVGDIEVQFFGVPKVFISAEENYQLSTIPSVVLNTPTISERRDLRNGNGEVDRAIARGKAKTRPGRQFFDGTVTIGCQAALKHEALAISDGMKPVFSQERVVMSEATGEPMTIVTATPISQGDQLARSLFVENWNVVLGGKAWFGAPAEKYVAEEIIHTVVPTGECSGGRLMGGAAGEGFLETVE